MISMITGGRNKECRATLAEVETLLKTLNSPCARLRHCGLQVCI